MNSEHAFTCPNCGHHVMSILVKSGEEPDHAKCENCGHEDTQKKMETKRTVNA